jgi:hypothetical protein
MYFGPPAATRDGNKIGITQTKPAAAAAMDR